MSKTPKKSSNEITNRATKVEKWKPNKFKLNKYNSNWSIDFSFATAESTKSKPNSILIEILK